MDHDLSKLNSLIKKCLAEAKPRQRWNAVTTAHFHEVFITMNKKPHKSGRVTLNSSITQDYQSQVCK